ncbi:MAG TPA: hypothetical protein VHI93_04990 [Candidatus Thermoplasmatota archaeon]|nr:hypothetical protein [Candidatus Thermoplasmatota archaeon]
MTRSEQANVTRLIRFLAFFVAVPTVTIGLALLLYAPGEHALHMGGFLLLGAAAVVAYVAAPRLAKRFTAGEAQ